MVVSASDLRLIDLRRSVCSVAWRLSAWARSFRR